MSNTKQRQLFIVGAPRSGTTLLRELLCQHSEIAMPRDEFQLLPYLLNKYGTKTALTQSDLSDVKRKLQRSPFYYHLKADRPIQELKLPLATIDAVILEILRYFSPEATSHSASWIGEKTPNNLLYIFKIAETFPGSKFIHVIRDPRDVAVSSHKAWGTSLTRSILYWEKHVRCAIAFEAQQPENIHHVRYEDLIANPEVEIRRISCFLNIDYQAITSHLSQPREKIGDAAGLNFIMQNNCQKYLRHLRPKDVAKIDGHLHSLMARYGYPSSSSRLCLNKNPLLLKTLAGLDFIRSFSWHIRDKGLLKGVLYRLNQVLLR